MTCLPCKEEIDNGMGRIAAQYLSEVADGKSPLVAAANFYARGIEEIFAPLSKKLLDMKPKLSSLQTESLMEQIDKQCYRADDIISWGRGHAGSTPEAVTAWIAELFQWAKDDQLFYTNLSAEVR